LAGDKSLADVIAHEIAHSWTGNLVTNATWSHFWLNEGWTVWLERKIMAKVKDNNEVLKLSAQSGLKGLKDDISRMMSQSDLPGFTQLVWPLENGMDPDDAFSRVPYEKVCFDF
jgi:leukotriene-A4 hydrolase